MKKILIIHTTNRKITDFAKSIKKGIESNGHKVDLLSTEYKDKMVTFFPYDIIIVGSHALGFFKGKIDHKLKKFLHECKRASGKKVITFVNGKIFAANSANKNLMAEMEHMGCFVYDFRVFKNADEAEEFGKQI